MVVGQFFFLVRIHCAPEGVAQSNREGLEPELNLLGCKLLGLLCGSGREVKIFHLLALGSPADAQGFWNGDGRGSMGRPAVGRLALISADFSLQEDLVLDL